MTKPPTPPPTPRMESMRHELLSDVAHYTADILRAHGVDDDVAKQAGCALSNHLAEHWGGQVLSFPKDYLYKLSQRDLKIYSEFDGSNHSDLARKYDVSVRAIYKIIKRARTRVVERNQPGLF